MDLVRSTYEFMLIKTNSQISNQINLLSNEDKMFFEDVLEAYWNKSWNYFKS